MEPFIYMRDDTIVSRRIGEEFILVPIRRKTEDVESIYTLNEMGAFIWEYLDGNTSTITIRDAIIETFEVSHEEAENDLVGFLHQLETLGVIQKK